MSRFFMVHCVNPVSIGKTQLWLDSESHADRVFQTCFSELIISVNTNSRVTACFASTRSNSR